jgi:hypothetical protein
MRLIQPLFGFATCFIAICVGASQPAHASSCEWNNDYYRSDSFEACDIDAGVVPLGCPVHLLLVPGHQAFARVMRNGAQVDVTGTIRSQTTLHSYTATDFLSCDCATFTATAHVVETTMDLTNVQVGDTVELTRGQRVIGEPGPCEVAAWPTTYVERARCDLCPEPPPTTHDLAGNGCNAAGDASALPGLVLTVGLVGCVARVSKKRRRQS